MGIFSGIAKIAAIIVVGPVALPLLMAGNWNGIDGSDGGCDDEEAITCNAYARDFLMERNQSLGLGRRGNYKHGCDKKWD
jgi:hypothetical protein